jgi:hypothetical protein
MKKPLLFIVLSSLSILSYSKEPLFFLSSEKIVQEKQGSLKSLCSFSFFPLLKIEGREANKIIELIDQELKKVALVIKSPVLTPEGANLDTFSNPSLQFIIEQLVDQKNKPLPILQASLSVSTLANLNKNQDPSALNT